MPIDPVESEKSSVRSIDDRGTTHMGSEVRGFNLLAVLRMGSKPLNRRAEVATVPGVCFGASWRDATLLANDPRNRVPCEVPGQVMQIGPPKVGKKTLVAAWPRPFPGLRIAHSGSVCQYGQE